MGGQNPGPTERRRGEAVSGTTGPPGSGPPGDDDGRDDHEVDRWAARWRSGEGRERVFRELFERYHRPLWGFFARRGFPPEDCHDLTQETFVRVYRGMDGFRGDARFETWLFKIAMNTYRKSLRHGSADKRDGHEVSLEDPEDGGLRTEAETAGEGVLVGSGPPPQPLDGVLRRERREALSSAVEKLPDQMRRCAVLRLYQDMAYKEIAAVMKVSIETVKAHLFQARKRLRAELADRFEEVEL